MCNLIVLLALTLTPKKEYQKIERYTSEELEEAREAIKEQESSLRSGFDIEAYKRVWDQVVDALVYLPSSKRYEKFDALSLAQQTEVSDYLSSGS